MNLILYKIFFFFMIIINPLHSVMIPHAPPDPLERLDYRAAFNFKLIQQKFYSLLERMQCHKNVFEYEEPNVIKHYQQKGVTANRSSEGIESHIALEMPLLRDFRDIRHDESSDFLGKISYDVDRRAYEEACLYKLKKERRSALLAPAKEAGIMICLLAGATFATIAALGSDSFGGNMSIGSSMAVSVWFVREIVRSVYYLFYTPPHDLDKFEEAFAINQCYIPRALWPMIIEKFITARRNHYEHSSVVSYIDFALGLTLYKPKPPLKITRGSEFSFREMIDIFLEDLNVKVDRFFLSYEDFRDPSEIYKIKMNLRKFMLSIFQLNGDSARYLYFYGSGGIGKTHLAQQIVSWIDEKIPNIVRYESFNVTSPEDLEGSEGKPGFLLNVLRNQCINGKRGSIVLMDEANFFNNSPFISPSKRVFNGNLSQIKISYFGEGADGTGITLNIPPIFLICTSNELIVDAALANRFDVINFPNPKKETLFLYSKKLLISDSLSLNIPGLLDYLRGEERMPAAVPGRVNYEEELSLGIRDLNSFRDIQAKVPILLRGWYERSQRDPGF